MTGREAAIECEEQRLRPAASEVDRLCCDNAKLMRLTGFKPQWDLERGLKATIDWLSEPGMLKRNKTDVFTL